MVDGHGPMPGCSRSRLRRAERSRTVPRVARSRPRLVCTGLSRALPDQGVSSSTRPKRHGLGSKRRDESAICRGEGDGRRRRLSKLRKPCGSKSVGAGGVGPAVAVGASSGRGLGSPGAVDPWASALPTSGPRHDLPVHGTPPVANSSASGHQERDRALHSTLTTPPGTFAEVDGSAAISPGASRAKAGGMTRAVT